MDTEYKAYLQYLIDEVVNHMDRIPYEELDRLGFLVESELIERDEQMTKEAEHHTKQ